MPALFRQIEDLRVRFRSGLDSRVLFKLLQRVPRSRSHVSITGPLELLENSARVFPPSERHVGETQLEIPRLVLRVPLMKNFELPGSFLVPVQLKEKRSVIM